MPDNQSSRKPTDEIIKAFEKDGFEVTKPVVTTKDGKYRGIHARSKTATNYETGEPKSAYYVEGDPYSMGYLTGVMAESDVEKMTTIFVNNIIFSFLKTNKYNWLRKLISAILTNRFIDRCYAKFIEFPDDIPKFLIDEMSGIADGCRNANPDTKVTFKRILALNAGIDTAVSIFYTSLWEILEALLFYPSSGERPSGFSPIPRTLQKVAYKRKVEKMAAAKLRLPMSCNEMSVFGNATADGKHYFGRDHMFTNGEVYQDTACIIIYNPDYTDEDGNLAIPLLSIAAPGFVGTPTVMNSQGLGLGVDISPSGNCDPDRPGFNSMLLIRYAGHFSTTAEEAVEIIVNAQRGAPWLYFIADGKGNRTASVEAGVKTDNLDYLSYPPKNLLELLPPQSALQKSDRGALVRWNDYVYNKEFLKYNKALFEKFGKSVFRGEFWEASYIAMDWTERKVPSAYYFAPQRESKPDVSIITNHYITPEMRLCAMHKWTVSIADNDYDDFQWRYDELNREIHNKYGAITEGVALELIDFLAPYPQDRHYPNYYKKNKKSSDGESYVIEGDVSLCNLTDVTVKSHFGYYKDEWVKITLLNYIGG